MGSEVRYRKVRRLGRILRRVTGVGRTGGRPRVTWIGERVEKVLERDERRKRLPA
jgi:hypothetical protein